MIRTDRASHRRTSIGIGMSLSAIIALAACSGGGGGGGATDGRGEITIWYSNNEQEVAWGKQMVEAWNAEHPDEQIKAQEIPAGKDTLFLPEPVIAPDGVESLAVLHRPMWNLDEVKPGEGVRLPAGITDSRQSIWISYVPLDAALVDHRNLVHWRGHRFVAGPAYPFEELKIGGGPPPIRVPEGWLLLHHGVTGVLASGTAQQQHVNYAAGAMLLDAADPSTVIARTPAPLLAPETPEEVGGIVPNVVFPTAIEEIDGIHYVFYGMADSQIGVARLDRVRG